MLTGVTVVESGGFTNVNESGATDTFTVVLDAQPTQDVTINVSSSDVTEGMISGSPLTFTSTNWNLPQSATVTGVDDGLADGDVGFQITFQSSSTDSAFDNLTTSPIDATNFDDESVRLLVSESDGNTTVLESGSTDTFEIFAATTPSADIVVNLASADSSEVTFPPSVTLNAGNGFRATVTVTGVDDDLLDGDQFTLVTTTASSVDGNYNGETALIGVTTTDEDVAPSSLVVDTLLDENDGVGTGGVSLRDAIAAIADNGTITFSVSGEIDLTNGQLVVNKPLSIDGANNITVDAQGNSRVFLVDDGNASQAAVSISGLTITGGVVTGFEDGGGIHNRESLTVSNAIVTNNVAGNMGFGGGIYNDSGTLNVSNSTISLNMANFGGGIENISQSGGTAITIITTTTFSQNTAGTGGGGINNTNFGISASVTISQSEISGNMSDVGGGVRTSGGNVIITDTTVDSNVATGSGGGINSTSDVSLVNSTVSGNMTNGQGGGVFNNTGTLTVVNSTLSGNSAGIGGGVYSRRTPTVTNSTITNSTITDNTSMTTGGGIQIETGTPSINNTIIVGNQGTNPDVDGEISSNGANIVGDSTGTVGLVGTDITAVSANAVIDPTLADNGGPTATHALALAPNSPAINAGNNSDANDSQGNPLTTDQRGVSFDRVVGGTVDIGAFESLVVAPKVGITGPGNSVVEGSDAVFTISLDQPATSSISVALLLADGTATGASGDFNPISAPGLATSVTFNVGEQTKQVPVATRQDGQIEPDETFTIAIAGVTGGEVDPSASMATVTIDGSELQIAPVDDQTIGAGAAPVSITIVSSSSNGAAATLAGTTVPSFGNFVDNNDGTGTLTFTPTAGDIGTETIEITATDASGSTSVMFDVNVVAPATLLPAPPFTAINAAGGTVGDFEADNSFNTGLRFSTGATIDTSDPSVPAGTPASIFQTTRWDPRSGDELAYNVAAPAGDYQVNLYFAEIYTPAARAGGRVFDISIEGDLVSDDFDIFAAAGAANKGIVESFNITSTGPTIDIEFGHEVENPAVMAIEIIDRNAILNNGPVLDSITPVSVAEGGSTTITVSATDPEGDLITLSNTGLPSFATFMDNGNGTATIMVSPATGDVGEYTIAVQAASGTPSLTDSTSFVLNVTAPLSPALPPLSPGAGTATNTGTPRTVEPTVSITGPSGPVAEGDDAIFTITLSEPFNEQIGVGIELTDGTATLASGDFAPLAQAGLGAVVGFDPGETSKDISIRTLRDMQTEPDEMFSLEITAAATNSDMLTVTQATATATITGAALTISPVDDQTIAADSGTVDLIISSTSSDNSPAMLSATSVPSFGSFVDNSNGTGTFTFDPTAADIGTTSIAITATDSNTSVMTSFDLSVLAQNLLPQATSVTRINAGDGAVGDFSADQSFNTGLRFSTGAAIDISDPSVPAGTPAELFQTTRFDPRSGSELSYNIDAPAGDYQVLLYFAEIYTPVGRVGGRVFDVSIEGNLVLDDFDIFAEAGAVNKGIVEVINVTTTGPTIDIDFAHVVENPAVMGIEIINVTPIIDAGPVVNAIPRQTATVGSTLSIPVSASDANQDQITLSLLDAPSFVTLNDNGDGTGTIEVAPSNGDQGEVTLSIQAESGTQSLTDLTGFTLAIEDLMGGNR